MFSNISLVNRKKIYSLIFLESIGYNALQIASAISVKDDEQQSKLEMVGERVKDGNRERL